MSDSEDNIVATITNARGPIYGPFVSNGVVSQAVKNAMRLGKWDELPPDAREGLDLIATKISRICTGDPEYLDNWDDIAG